MKTIRVVLIAQVAALVLALLIDLLMALGENANTIAMDGAAVNGANAEANAVVTISQVDRARGRVIANIDAEVRATTTSQTFHDIVLVPEQMSKTGNTMLSADARQFVAGEYRRNDGNVYARVSVHFKDVELEIAAAGLEQFYPFDRVRVLLSMRGCANVPDGGTCSAAPIRFSVPYTLGFVDATAIRFEPSRTGTNRLSLRRPLFDILLTMYFGIIAITFLVFLFRVEGEVKIAANALGTLAALWGLRDFLVPKTINAYPTLIDYFVLFAFSVVFALVMWRFHPRRISDAKS
jgi:hypothetical protein